MPSLIAADICRDGGSISAVIMDGGKYKAFWLETNNWDHPSQRGYESLFVSEGDNPKLKELCIKISSKEEVDWLNYFEQVDCTNSAEDAREQFQNLVAVLRRRRTS